MAIKWLDEEEASEEVVPTGGVQGRIRWLSDEAAPQEDYSKKNYNEGIPADVLANATPGVAIGAKKELGDDASLFKSFRDDEYSKSESALRGASQGLTAGFGEEIAAGIISPFSDQTYQEIRDAERMRNEVAREQNPWSYGGAEVGGLVATSIAAPGVNAFKGGRVAGLSDDVAAAAKNGDKAAKALLQSATRKDKLAQVGNAALTGAYQGGLEAAGTSDADTLTDLAADTAKGAGIGAAFGGVADRVGAGASSVAKSLKDFAEDRAFKAAGGTLAQARKLRATKGDNAKSDLARFLLDEGIVTPFTNTEKMADKVADISKLANNKLDKIHEVIDLNNLSSIKPSKIIEKLEKLKNPKAVDGTAQQAANDHIDKIIEMVRTHTPNEKGFFPLKEARALRQAIDENTNFNALTDSSAKLKNRVGRNARNIVKDEITGQTTFDSGNVSDLYAADVRATLPRAQREDIALAAAAEDVAPTENITKLLEDSSTDAETAKLMRELFGDTTPSPNIVSDAFDKANKQVGHSIEAQKLLRRQADAEAGNQFLGLGSKVLAGGGGAAGGPKGMLIGAAVGKMMEKGPQMAAVGADKLSKGVAKLDPETINTIGTTAGRMTSDVVTNESNENRAFNKQQAGRFRGTDKLKAALRDNPQSLGKYAGPLQAAAEKGDKQLNATVFSLSQSDPEFRLRFKSFE